jgi:hypothetical protein
MKAGAGPVGLACAACCFVLGAAVVVVGDLNEARLAQVFGLFYGFFLLFSLLEGRIIWLQDRASFFWASLAREPARSAARPSRGRLRH